jgi:F0F1-type ATP synthase assembly protein I
LKKKLSTLKDWQKNQIKAYHIYIKTSAVGLEFGLSIAVGALLGYFFDRYFITSPYGLLVGVFLGSIAAVKRLITFVKSYLKQSDKNDE